MSIIDSLIIDRTSADVSYARQQTLKILQSGWDSFTESEQSEYLAGLKGAYNPSDLNRVTHAMEYLVERLRSYGYFVRYERVKVPHQPQRGKSRLPDGYTELEYIESTGTQYIDTGFKPNNNTRVVMDADVTSNTTDWKALFSVRTNSTTGTFGIIWTSSQVYTPYYGSLSSLKFTGIAQTGRRIYDQNKEKTTIGGQTLSYTNTAFQCSYNLYLLALCTAGTPNWHISAKLYSCKMYDNGTLIRDFIPCKNPDGVVGLYDLVNNKFYGNSGSGSFIAGGELIPRKLPEGYTQVTYIQSSGTQYIDTGFVPNQDTRVVCDCEYPASSSSWLFAVRVASGKGSFSFLSYNNRFRTDYGASYTQYFATSTTQVTRIDKNKNITTINGNETLTDTTTVFNSTYPLFLFAVNTAGTPSGYSSAKLKNMQIYDNGTLVRDFVPCTNASDTVGLYDMVNGVFYANAGTGVFTAGAEVELLPVEILDDYTWYHSDIPQANELNAYLQNVKWLREAMVLYPNTPEAPADMEGFTFTEANDIERILVNIETIINLMLSSIIYSGEIFSGEVI